MSFWDSIKPTKQPPRPTRIQLAEDKMSLSIAWDDGAHQTVTCRTLRQLCPCAGCVEEWSGKRTFDVETIPQGMKIIEIQSVGNYALAFTFGDMHRTGIFQWEFFKKLSEPTADA
jgi:DUF971 family protein